MSHAYVVRPKVDKSGETEKIRYYGVPVTSGQVSTEQLATCISTRCTLSRGEILAAIIEIGREIQFQLDMGYTINLHGIGTLFLSAGSEGYENPKDCTILDRRYAILLYSEGKLRFGFHKLYFSKY